MDVQWIYLMIIQKNKKPFHLKLVVTDEDGKGSESESHRFMLSNMNTVVSKNSVHIHVTSDTIEKIENTNGSIIVNGTIKGNVQNTNAAITVHGSVQESAKTTNGTIVVEGNVNGNISTSNGSIKINGSSTFKKANISTSNASIYLNGSIVK